jgi:Tfp pilus assembly protein PilO
MSKVRRVRRVRRVFQALVVAFALASLVLAFLVFVGWYYVVSKGQEANKITAETENLRNEAIALSDLSLKYKKVLPQREVVMDALPKDKDISVFVADFENLAKTDNITVNTSAVGDITAKGKGDLSQTISKQDYLELPITYSIEGSYSDFNKFIQDLNTLRRLNTVRDLTLRSESDDKGSADKINANFVVSIYIKQEK